MIPVVHSRSLRARIHRGLSAVFALAVVGILTPTLARAEPGQNPPRYQLKVGQKIEYRDGSKSDRENAPAYKFGLVCWVVGENPDHSHRLLFHHEMVQIRVDEKGTESTNKIRDSYGYFDLFADGKVVPSKKFSVLQPERFFPRLPDAALTADATWESQSQDDWSKYLFKASPPAAESTTWSFEVRKEEPWDAIYLISSGSSEVFDLERGLVVSATVRGEQGWPNKQTNTGTRELVTSEQLPDAETRQLAEEAAIYFQATEGAQPLLDAADRDFKNTTELLDRAEKVFAGLDGQLKLPLFREILDAERESRKRSRTYSIEEAEKFARQLDQPSAEWQTNDLDGAPHALKDYRGKVVLLDFWYRGCGWCIRAMPQMKQLADDFKDQPVAILGINSDRDAANAQFVIDALKLPYPTLKNQVEKEGEGISAKYSINGFPTLVLIDQQGVVRDIHVGYSPTLRNDLAVRIRGLLAAGKTAASDGPEQK